MSERVLVTGGFGLVGSATVKQLAADGRRVVVADLDTPANRKKAKKLPAGVEVRWADLTDAAEVERLLADVTPAAIIHLAAVIPPPIYRNAKLARKVNVGATAALVRAADAQPTPPRFVQASSNAVYGFRNPHRHDGPVTAETPPRAVDLYSGTKLERRRTGACFEPSVGGAAAGRGAETDPKAMPFSADALFFESCLPTDGRMHSVDVRNVATAFA